MTPHWKLIRLLVLVPLAVAIVASSSVAEKANKVAGKSSNAKAQAAPTVSPGTTATPAAGKSIQPTGATGATAPLFKLDWYSINGGGGIDASSPGYKAGVSIGQPVAGEASSAGYKLGIGFWHGAGGCNCPRQGDYVENGVIDINDVLNLIKVAFTNGTDVQDSDCPTTRGDVNKDSVVNVNDVLYLIKTAFTNGPGPLDPCTQ